MDARDYHLVHLATVIKGHRPDGLQIIEIYFSNFRRLEVQVRVLTWSGEDSLLGHRLLVVSVDKRGGEGAPWSLSCKGTSPIQEGSALLPKCLPKPHLIIAYYSIL